MTYPKGFDVSKWNLLTWRPLDRKFMFARATYGVTPDPKFYEHIHKAKGFGMKVGAYHFGVGFADPVVQAKLFLSVAGPDMDFYVLDLENDPTDTMSEAQARKFIEYVKSRGFRCGLYHSAWRTPAVGQSYNWKAQWADNEPPEPWTFWQYQGAPFDLNYFNGTLAALEAFAVRTGSIPKGATMRVTAVKTARLFALKRSVRYPLGVMRPVYSDTGSFTFTSYAGANQTNKWASGTADAPDGTTVFRKLIGKPHDGLYVRVSDDGYAWDHTI